MGTKVEATCPGCGHEFNTFNNDEVCCPRCDLEFVVCDEDALTMWD